MTDIPHELHGSFPQYAEKMDNLRETDPGFAKLFEEYDEVNQKIHLAETFEKPTSPLREDELKRRRVALRDEIYRVLSAG